MVLNRILRAGEGKIVRRLKVIAEHINTLEPDYVDLTDAELRAKTDEFKERYADGESLDHCCPRRSPSSARRPPARWASGTSTCSSWAARRCTWATSPR